MRGNEPHYTSDFGGFPDGSPTAPPDPFDGPAPVAGSSALLAVPPPPQPNGATPAQASALTRTPPKKSPKKSGGVAPTTKYGLVIIGALVAIGFIAFGVLLGREVASLTVIENLEVGDCVSDHFRPVDDAAEGEFFEILFVTQADCVDPHAYELYAATTLWETGDVFPGVDAAFWSGEDYCQQQFANFLGDGYLGSPYEVFTFVPTVGLWNEGHREVQCFIGHSDGMTLVSGSLRNAGPIVSS